MCLPRPPPARVIALGARITGVDDRTYSSTGESFSTVILPHAESTALKKLQADDVSLCAATPPRPAPLRQRSCPL